MPICKMGHHLQVIGDRPVLIDFDDIKVEAGKEVHVRVTV